MRLKDEEGVEIELLIEEPQRGLGHRPARPLRTKVVPEADRDAVHFLAVDGGEDALGACHVVHDRQVAARLREASAWGHLVRTLPGGRRTDCPRYLSAGCVRLR